MALPAHPPTLALAAATRAAVFCFTDTDPAAADGAPRTTGTCVVISDIEEKRCSYHPNVLTRLRCSKCGKPICPRCAVETPVGFRCPDCAAVRGLPTYQTNTVVLLKSIGIGLVIAIVVGLVWGRFPNWNFYLALILGFGVAEGM